MTDLYSEALERFEQVYSQAREHGISEYNAMSLATVDSEGRPDVRIVLLKDFDATGFVFYTNLHSVKGEHLQHNPNASLCFFWRELYLQVRIDGRVETVSEAEADAYFATRVRGSQIGAWASAQSHPLASRSALEELTREYQTKFANDDVPRPPHWSGYRLKPRRMEFWVGRESRLHERTLYSLEDGTWRKGLLNP